MNKVYAVTEGEYSDYCVRAIFSTYEMAEKFQAANEDTNYEIIEYDLDSPKVECDVYYGIEVDVNDKSEITDVLCIRDTKPIEPFCREYGYRNYNQRTYRFPITQQGNKDRKQLKKIAQDKIAEYEATRLGLT